MVIYYNKRLSMTRVLSFKGSRVFKALPAILSLLLFCTIQAGCMRFRAPYSAGKNQQIGIASWYGPKFHGRTTASGERYDMNDLTAAHKHAPLGTIALVENLSNGKKVRVRINDRGPFVGDRIIDLSYRAARKIAMVSSGTAKVKVTFLGDYDPARTDHQMKYYIQVASFRQRQNAIKLKGEIEKLHNQTFVHRTDLRGRPIFRVCVGPIEKPDDMIRLRDEIRDIGYSPMLTVEKCSPLQNSDTY